MGEVVQHGTSAYLSDDSKAAQQRLSCIVEKEQLLSQPLEEPGGFRNKARHGFLYIFAESSRLYLRNCSSTSKYEG